MNVQPRRPLLALAAALAMPGLGQLYSGDIVRGLLFLLSTASTVPLATHVALKCPVQALCYVVFLGVASTLALYAWSAVDALRLAKVRRESALLPYQRATVYLLYVAFGYLWVLWPAAAYTRRDRVEAFRVPSSSMAPTILPGDRLFADKTIGHPGGTKLWRGALALFVYPNERTSTFVKRVIGLPGDRIEITGLQVLVNGRPLTEPRDPTASCELPGHIQGTCMREQGDKGTYWVSWSAADVASQNDGAVLQNGPCRTVKSSYSETIEQPPSIRDGLEPCRCRRSLV